MVETKDEKQWYVVVDGKPEGPFDIRDMDVKFRTTELNSNCFVWRDGQAEWLKAFQEPTLRQLIQDSKTEAAEANPD